MARGRVIKPEFWSAEQVVDCSIEARLLFIGIWNFADDNGVIPASPRSIKMQVFPGDSFTTDQIRLWVDELLGQGLLAEFDAEDKSWWYVTGWKRHQKIEAPRYKYPVPPATPQKTSKPDTETTPNSNHNTNLAPSPAIAIHHQREQKKTSKFDDFKAIYPHPFQRERECFLLWQEMNLTPIAAIIIADVESRKRDDVDWQEKYHPSPLTYLQGRRWEDEIRTQRRGEENAKSKSRRPKFIDSSGEF